MAGPNGAGKTTFYYLVLGPKTCLALVNADLIAARHWPGDTATHAYEAAVLAEKVRNQLIDERQSFIAETVFSHPSKVDLIRRANDAGYQTTLHVLLVPEAAAVARVADRVANDDGHDVPEEKVRSRYGRMWAHIAAGVILADTAYVYDNSASTPAFRRIAQYVNGTRSGVADWPGWTPSELVML
ncbi:MAG: zeta toxin family protein [Acidimicrobiales bacterium]